jgi:hypothetical protein
LKSDVLTQPVHFADGAKSIRAFAVRRMDDDTVSTGPAPVPISL